MLRMNYKVQFVDTTSRNVNWGLYMDRHGAMGVNVEQKIWNLDMISGIGQVDVIWDEEWIRSG
jgi:hypothetical protein